MKYALVTVLDQTIGFWKGPGYPGWSWTTVHREAKLFDSEEDAKAGLLEASKEWKEYKEDDIWLEEVPDIDEWNAREDTW